MMVKQARGSLLRFATVALAVAQWLARGCGGMAVRSHQEISIGFPVVDRDWEQIAELVVDTFDLGDEGKSDATDDDDDDFVGRLWSSVERALTKRRTYRRYAENARRLRGAKYDLLVARDSGKEVIGLAELGVNASGDEPRPTLGVLCVRKEFRGRGAGRKLVQACEKRASIRWRESVLYTEVEPSNDRALAFFDALGYYHTGETVAANVRTNYRHEESRPHLLLCKTLPIKGNDNDDDD